MINKSKVTWRAVARYSMKTGDLLQKYSSITEASRKTGINRQGINHCVRGRSKHCGGYFWSYIENYNQESPKVCCKCKILLTNQNRFKDTFHICKECHKLWKINRLNYINEFILYIYRRQKDTAKKTQKEVLYTSEELLEWVSKQDIFFRMYRNWVETKHSKKQTPYIVRIDSKKTYSLDNLEVLSKDQWKRKRRIPVEQWDKEGTKLLCTYSSIGEASDKTGIPVSKIVNVAKARRSRSGTVTYTHRSSGGYHWKYSKKFKEIKEL